MRDKKERRDPGDRRATKRRTADKLKAKLAAAERARFASESVTSTGMGPVSFDLAQARRAGWTPAQIQSFWSTVIDMYQNTARRVQRAHPELYRRWPDGTVIYVGPDEHGRRLKITGTGLLPLKGTR